MAGAEQTVLRRKADAGKSAPDAAVGTPVKALRLVIGRVADATLGCQMTLRDIAMADLSVELLMPKLPDPGLFLALAGAEGAIGLAVFCPGLAEGAVQSQTLGRVLPASAQIRSPTRTDGLLLTDFLDRVLSGLGDIAGAIDGVHTDGFAVSGVLGDARSAAMTLGDKAHLHLLAEIDLAEGVRQGQLHLVLPLQSTSKPEDACGKAGWAARIDAAVNASATRLEAVLCRQSMPLSAVQALEPGTVLHLGRAGLDTVVLVGSDGRRLTGGTLGRSGPMRAVRVDLGPVPAKARADGG